MFVVAIPVCNEQERIAGCLDALSVQVDVDPCRLGILLFLNNCSDDTRNLVDEWESTSSTALRVVQRDSADASAGWARREAMDAAAAWLEETSADDKTLLTTDADSRVPPNWVALNRDALIAGADAVAGRVLFDPFEVVSLPSNFTERQKLEFEYETLLAEIEARLAPHRGNPWPCHWTHSGASIAVSLSAYRRVGGLPPLCSGEDHAFVNLLRANGLVVRNAPEIVVTTSGRLDGRARDGTADTLRRRCADLDSPCDLRLESLAPFVLGILSRRLGASNSRGISLKLRRQPVRPKGLPKQIGRARWLLRLIRLFEAHRDDSLVSASGLSPSRPRPLLMP